MWVSIFHIDMGTFNNETECFKKSLRTLKYNFHYTNVLKNSICKLIIISISNIPIDNNDNLEWNHASSNHPSKLDLIWPVYTWFDQLWRPLCRWQLFAGLILATLIARLNLWLWQLLYWLCGQTHSSGGCEWTADSLVEGRRVLVAWIPVQRVSKPFCSTNTDVKKTQQY